MVTLSLEKEGSKDVLKDNFIGKGQTSDKDCNNVEASEDSDVFKEGVKGLLDRLDGEAVARREEMEGESGERRKQTEENSGWDENNLHQKFIVDEPISVSSEEKDSGEASPNKQVCRLQETPCLKPPICFVTL